MERLLVELGTGPAMRDELSYFVDCIRQDREPDVITPSEAARAVRVMEAAERSAETQQPIDLEAA